MNILKRLVSLALFAITFSVPVAIYGMDDEPKDPQIDHRNVKRTIDEHLQRCPDLLNSSQDKDIVVFLGNTGAGKSTLINYLSGKKLVVNDDNEIVLEDPADPSAMAIGTSGASQTFLPSSVQSGDLLFYDLPGFGDNRGTAISLVNACFIKSIIEKAKSVKLVFVAGMGEISEVRGRSFNEFLEKIKQLIPGKPIENFSSLIITKSDQRRENLSSFLKRKVDMTPILNSWIDNGRVSQMSKPRDPIIGDDERVNILTLIGVIGSERIANIDIGVIYDVNEQLRIKGIYDAEIQAITEELILENYEPKDLSAMDEGALNDKNTYMRDSFKELVRSSLDKSSLISLLRPISENLYQSSLRDKEQRLTVRINQIEAEITAEIHAKQMQEEARRRALAEQEARVQAEAAQKAQVQAESAQKVSAEQVTKAQAQAESAQKALTEQRTKAEAESAQKAKEAIVAAAARDAERGFYYGRYGLCGGAEKRHDYKLRPGRVSYHTIAWCGRHGCGRDVNYMHRADVPGWLLEEARHWCTFN